MLIAGVWVSECCSKKNVVVTLMMQYIAERRSAEQDVASVMLMTQYTADRRSAEQDAASVMLMTQYTADRRSAEQDVAFCDADDAVHSSQEKCRTGCSFL